MQKITKYVRAFFIELFVKASPTMLIFKYKFSQEKPLPGKSAKNLNNDSVTKTAFENVFSCLYVHVMVN